MKYKIERKQFNESGVYKQDWTGKTAEDRIKALTELSIMMYKLKELGKKSR